MEDILRQLRMYEYSAETFEEDNYPDATPEDVKQSKYEYMYLRNLGDYLEILIKKNKYSNEDMVEKMKNYFDKMYSDFQKNKNYYLSDFHMHTGSAGCSVPQGKPDMVSVFSVYLRQMNMFPGYFVYPR